MRARPWSHHAATHEGRLVAVLGVSALIGGLVAAIGVASADSAAAVTAGILQPGVAITGVTDWGSSWLGAMQAPAGYGDDVAFCITAGGGDPVGTTPVSVGTVPDPQLASVMALHRWDNDAITRGAISYLSHMRWETGSKTVSAQTRKARYEAHTPQNVKDRAVSLLAEARSVAGPYAGSALQPAGVGTRTGDVHNVGVVNSAGGWTSGLPFTATLSGPALFDATHSPSYSGTTSNGPLTLSWTATGPGTVTASVLYHDAPRVTLTFLGGAGTTQSVLTYGHRPAGADPLERVSPPVTFDVVGQFQPVASTAVGSKTVTQGGALVDGVTVGTAPGDSWLTVAGRPVPVTFVGTAYATGLRPPAGPGPVPPGAVALGTTSLTVTGPGTYAASIPGVGTGEFVTWVWWMSVAQQPAAWQPYLRGDWQDAFGWAPETASVRHRASATSQVVVRSDETGRPVGLADDVVVVGFPDDHPGFAGGAGFTADRPTITQSLWYFPEGVEVTDARRGEATLLGQVDLPAANGTHASIGDGAFTLPVTATGAGLPGTYVFTHRFDGDDRVEPFETSVTATSEQLPLAHRPLALTTVAVAERAVVLRDQVVAHDVATVTGDIPVGATVAFELYQWEHGGPPTCVAPEWTSPALTLTGEGDVVSPPGDVAVLTGDLGFVAVVRDTDGTVLARGECGADDETLPAGTYDVVTTAEAERAPVLGDQVVVHDTAEATGTVPTDATLTFELYTWEPGAQAVCEEPLWVSDPVPFVLGGTTSPEVLVDPLSGDLGFVEVVHGTDGRELSRGECGAPGETITAGTYAVVTTALADRAAVFGDEVTVRDTAGVTGMVPTDATITFELYTWPTGTGPVCDDPLWTSDAAPLVVGESVSPEVAVDPVRGDLGFTEVVRGSDGRMLSRGLCGAPGETVVDDELAVATVARSTGPVVLGRSADVWDEATVTGHPAGGTTLTFELYEWPVEATPTCSAPVWTSEPVALTGPGAVSSPVTTVSSVRGSLGFVQVTRGADGRVLARGGCGEPGETLTAVPELAQTGAGDWRLAALAGVLLVGGAAVVALSRRRDR